MKLKSVQKRLQKDLKKNKKGGIEGLPLQLMILIVIATLGTAVIVGWMGNIETPHSIGDVDIESGDIRLTTNATDGYYTTQSQVKVCVYDQDGNPLEGASIVLTGLGVKTTDNQTPYGTTDSDGLVIFKGLKMKHTGTIDFITVTVTKTGYGENSACKIAVIS